MVHNNRSCPEQLKLLRKDFEEFTYIISHDLKAPVRAISNLSAWIEEDLGTDIPENVQQNLSLLLNRANRLELMIEALSKYSRAVSLHIPPEVTDVRELLEAAMSTISGNKDLQLIADGALPTFVTYKEKLASVIAQIMHNTVTFGKEHKLTMTVAVKEEADHYKFEMADNGGGVPEQTVDKLIKMFYTVAPKDAVNTTGAGLSIANKIIQVVGGELWILNNDQGGLTVHFTWPEEINIA